MQGGVHHHNVCGHNLLTMMKEPLKDKKNLGGCGHIYYEWWSLILCIFGVGIFVCCQENIADIWTVAKQYHYWFLLYTLKNSLHLRLDVVRRVYCFSWSVCVPHSQLQIISFPQNKENQNPNLNYSYLWINIRTYRVNKKLSPLQWVTKRPQPPHHHHHHRIITFSLPIIGNLVEAWIFTGPHIRPTLWSNWQSISMSSWHKHILRHVASPDLTSSDLNATGKYFCPIYIRQELNASDAILIRMSILLWFCICSLTRT